MSSRLTYLTWKRENSHFQLTMFCLHHFPCMQQSNICFSHKVIHIYKNTLTWWASLSFLSRHSRETWYRTHLDYKYWPVTSNCQKCYSHTCVEIKDQRHQRSNCSFSLVLCLFWPAGRAENTQIVKDWGKWLTLFCSLCSAATVIFIHLNWGQVLSDLGCLTDVWYPSGNNKVVQNTIINVMEDS